MPSNRRLSFDCPHNDSLTLLTGFFEGYPRLIQRVNSWAGVSVNPRVETATDDARLQHAETLMCGKPHGCPVERSTTRR
jgi:hypothetical protein